MKKALKIVVPIILAVVLLGCSIWYLFIYDRDFTQDMLLKTARYFDDKGNASAAQMVYNWAYNFGEDNDAVAIELANQYKDDGNYSKAEYTLYKAIQNGGGHTLYMELSKIYVEQGKLNDALKLVETAPKAIQEKLISLQPASPIPNVKSDTELDYYGPISFTADGKLYLNADNQFPSVKTGLYSGPVTLKAGENLIQTVVVSPNGLVKLDVFKYTVHGVIEPVKFADAAFEAQIREVLEIPEETIYTNQLWDISSFTIPKDARSFEDLKHLLFLQHLTIEEGASGQLSLLSEHEDLIELHITGIDVSNEDLAIIGELSNLSKLTLADCGIISASSLSKLTNLTYLDLQNNNIMDLSPLSGMTGLTELYLNDNHAIKDLSVLQNFKNLTKLNVSNNNLETLSPVFSLTKLTWLSAGTQGQSVESGISSIEGIEKLTQLTYLDLSNNQITDITQLSSCTALTELNISSNKIVSLEPLAGHMELMKLNFSYNMVAELPQWDKECMLVTIDGSHNLIATLEPLADLHALNNVYMDYNEEIESVDCLITCHALLMVSVDGTKVKNADVLLWYYPEDGSAPMPTGIKVKFDPTKEED